MAIELTAAQVLALAPDAASGKAARSLANPKPWTGLGQDGRAVWGACQGSGADPYRTQVDWAGPAFKCSCPSRKFPCKHGLALLMLLAEHPGCFPSGDPPEWVKTWISAREQRAEPRPADAPVDEAARARRAAQRSGRVAEGLDLLELWLRDLAGQGLASAPGRGFPFWDQQAARLVDAQAPGAARLVRQLGGIVVSGLGWQDRLLNALGRLVLLIHAHRKLNALPPETQADVRTAIGFPTPLEEVLAREPVRDEWLVTAQRVYTDDRLRVQRFWLAGRDTGRTALLLDFAAGSTGFKTSLVPGTAVVADLCFFPGAVAQRAAIRQLHGAATAAAAPPGQTIAATYDAIGRQLAANPWLESQPVLLRGAVPVPSERHWVLTDPTGSIACHPDFALLAASGGHPLDVAGEWDGDKVRPLAVFADRWIQLPQAVAL